MKLKASLRMWTLSGTLSSLTLYLELVNNYINVSNTYRAAFFVVVGVIMLVSFFKSIKSFRHINTMRLIGKAIKAKAKKSNDLYELQLFNSFDSLARALVLDRDTYDEENTWSIQRWSEFYKKNKFIAFGLFYSNDIEQLNCLGGISCFPINKEMFYSLKKGELSEMDITAEDILDENEMNASSYRLIPGLVIFSGSSGSIKSSMLLTSFLNWMVQNTRFPLSFIAFGYSYQGRKILSKFGFSKFKISNVEYSVYTNTISSVNELILKIPSVLKR